MNKKKCLQIAVDPSDRTKIEGSLRKQMAALIEFKPQPDKRAFAPVIFNTQVIIKGVERIPDRQPEVLIEPISGF